MKPQKRKVMFGILKWVVIAALCMLCAFGIEKIMFQESARSADGLNQEYSLENLEQTGFTYENGELVSAGRYAQVVLPAGGYMHSLHIEYQTAGMQAAVWSTEAQPDFENLDMTNSWEIDYRAQVLEKIIGVQADKLVVTFLDIEQPIRISAISFHDNQPFHIQRFIFFAAIFMAFAAIIIGYKNFRGHPERIVAVVCAMLGIAMLSGISYEKVSWDDETHFANAYRLSYTLTGQDTQWTQATEDFIKLRLPFTHSYQERLNLEQYLNEAGQIPTETEESGGVPFVMSNIKSLPTAVGILIGRAIGVEFSNWYILARLLNLLFYTTVLYFAIKLVPTGKSLMAFLALLPTPVFLTMSYNTDYFMNSLMMLAMAVFFREYFTPEKRISKQSILIFTLAMFFACIGKAIYIPLILLGLLLPESKFASRKQKRIYYGILVGCCVLVLLFVVLNATGMSDPRGGDTSVSEQISYILHNPVTFAIVFLKAIAKNSIEFIFGCEATLNFNIAGIYEGGMAEIIMLITLVLLIVLAKGKDKRYEISWKTTVLGYGIIGLVICFIWGSMYLAFTPVGSNVINGVQARYYIPFLFPLFLLIPTQKIKSELSESVVMSVTLGIVVLLNTVSVYNLMILE